MTYASVAVDGEVVDLDDVQQVQVSFPAEDGAEARCRHCHETIEERSDGWYTDPLGNTGWDCEANDSGPHEPETGPGTWCNSASIVVNDEEDSVTCTISVGDPRGAFGFAVRKVPAQPDRCLHCGGPIEEGGHGHKHTDIFQSCTEDAEPTPERLILHVPYPGEGWAHMPLTLLHEGTYLIGGA